MPTGTSKQHLHMVCPGFEVIAYIGGRGFKQRREDMKKMLVATKVKFSHENPN